MRRRFFRAATVSIIAGLLIAFLFAVPLMEQIYTDEAENRLRTALALSTGYAAEQDCQTMARKIGRRLEEAGLDIRLTVISVDGTVLGDSEASPDDMQDHGDRPEVREALAEGEGREIRQSETTGGKNMYLAQKVEQEDGNTQVYRVSIPIGGLGEVQKMLWGCGAIGIFMGLIAALISAAYSAGRVVEPLQSLTRAAREMAAGGEPVHVDNAPDEMGELASAFNRMSDRLTAAHKELAHSNEQLAGVLQGMDDGVVAIDAVGNVTLLTDRAQEMLGACPAGVSRLAECGANYLRVLDDMEQAMKTGRAVRESMAPADAPEKILEVYASQAGTPGEGGALAVISDVTRLRKLEIMRSEFAANVTHELKTPLTSIRGYIELLKSGPRDEETAQSFYEIIEIEAERLQRLTDDLLQLSEIENGGSDAEAPCALLEDVVTRAVESLRPQADRRGVRMTVRIEPGLTVRAHEQRLYQMMKNLMENAVKYNRDDGTVEVTARNERGMAVIRVQDTGIGILPEHLDRIFERFYRVDKGRSREQGGTGLGLSIVKHIVNLYRGDIQVESKPGFGTTFTIRMNPAEDRAV